MIHMRFHMISYDFILGTPQRHNHVMLGPYDIMLTSYDVGGPPPPGHHNPVMSGPYDIMLKSYDMTYDVGGSLHNVICHVI